MQKGKRLIDISHRTEMDCKCMNVVFRADANKNIGMGHIMRCLSIADALSGVGCHVDFLVADDGVSKQIIDRGYNAIVLNSDYQSMDEELAHWPNIVANLIIIDSYYVTRTYFLEVKRRMKGVGGKLIYLDDVLSFPYPVDILINYNSYAAALIYDNLYAETSVKKPHMILGPTFAPLRSMFRGVPGHPQPKKVESILISTGGSDELHLALSIIRFLSENKREDRRVYHFLLGAMNADKESIRELAMKNEHIVIHENVSDMRRMICSSDLVISAAGSTLYEIASCGVPLITYSIADNQMPGAEAFERLGLGINVGDLRNPAGIDSRLAVNSTLDDCAVQRIMSATEELAADYDRRCKMGKLMQKMVDGFGADRMVKEIMKWMCSQPHIQQLPSRKTRD